MSQMKDLFVNGVLVGQVATAGDTRLLTAALNDLNQNHYHRDDQEDVNDSAHRIRGDETQKPEDDYLLFGF